jgi:hypothetical protein
MKISKMSTSTAVRTPDMIKTVQELITTDSRITLRMIEEVLEINGGTTRRILMEDPTNRKICASSVPHCLNKEQKALSLEASQELIQSMHGNRFCHGSVVTGDKTWCF